MSDCPLPELDGSNEVDIIVVAYPMKFDAQTLKIDLTAAVNVSIKRHERDGWSLEDTKMAVDDTKIIIMLLFWQPRPVSQPLGVEEI